MPSLFGIEVKKEYFGYTWVNGYTVVAPDLTAAAQAADMLGQFEVWTLFDVIKVTTARAYGWETGPSTDFVVVDINELGHYGLSSDRLAPPQDCFWVDLQTASGRYGKKFYRGGLRNFEVTWAGSSIGYSSTPGIATGFAAAATDLLEGLDGIDCSLRMGVSAAAPTGRVVTGLLMHATPAHVNTHHGWFNKNA